MSHFATDLDIRLLRGKFKQGRQLYQLLAPLVYMSSGWGRIEVPAGFITDFASVPKLPLTWLAAGGTANEAAVVHDWLYTVHRVGPVDITRSEADAIFREAIPASEDPNAPAFLMWLAVRFGGSNAWDAAGPDQPPTVRAHINELTAP